VSNPVISGTAPQWGAVGQSLQTLPVKPFNAGDLLVLEVFANGGPVTAVAGGGVAAWGCASSYFDTARLVYAAIWWGVVTSPGHATITITDAGEGTNYATLWAREFTAIGASWSVVTASSAPGTTGGTPPGSGSAVTYPSLSPSAGGNDLYLGAGWSYFGHILSGSTPGFIYTNPASNGPNQACYNPSVSVTTAPTATTTDSPGPRLTVAAIFTAGGGIVTGPAYAASYSIIASGTGNWSNPGNATGVPAGSYATWTAP
jgi:hypothetical protein